MNEAETNIDWSLQIDLIRRRFEAALRAGETIDGLQNWLDQVPPPIQPKLKTVLEDCQSVIGAESVETQVLPSDAELGHPLGDSGDFSHDNWTSESAIANCRTFSGLSSVASLALQGKFTERTFDQGSRLLQQGQSASGLYLVTSGNVDIINVATGERIDVDGAGTVLGEMSLLTGQPCSADVIATSNVTALVLSTDDYRELINSHPELEIAVSQLVSDRLGGRRHDALCGKRIGDYTLVKCINRGGMGVVYEAYPSHRDADGVSDTKDTSDSVALKMLRHRFIYDESMQQRFDQEAALLRGLNHPNIVAFQNNFLAYRTRFLVLDLCDGSDLYRLLRRAGPMDETVARAAIGQVAAGLKYAHQAGVIHRDLKPGNVLVDNQGNVKLTDFGLSRLLQSEVDETKAVGTPSYMPPEQFRGDDGGPESDYYALGCLISEMLTGKLLFRGNNWRELYAEKRDRIPGAGWPAIDVSEELRALVGLMLSPLPMDRQIDLDHLASWADTSEVLRWQES